MSSLTSPRRVRQPDQPYQTGRRAPWQAALRRLLWWEPFWIALLAPSLLLPGRFWVTALQPLWVVLLFAGWPLRLLAGRGAWRRSPFDLPLWLLLASAAAAVAVSPAPASSWEAAGYLLLGLAACTALLQWPPLQARPERLASLLLAGGAAVAAAGPLLLGSQLDALGLGLLAAESNRWVQAAGEIVNPNVLGGALLIPALLAAALALGPRWSQRPWRAVWAAVALLFAVEVLLTHSRGAVLGLAAGLLLLAVLRWPASGWLLVPAAGLGLFLAVMGGGLALAFDSIGAVEARSAVGIAGEGLPGRLAIWRAALQAIRQQPLTGIGLGLFGPWVDQHGLMAADIYWQPHAHNLPLQVTADLGLPGLVACLGLLLASAAMLAGSLAHRPQARHRGRRRGHAQPARAALPAPGLAPAYAPAATVRVPVAAVHRQRLHWTLAAGCAAALGGVLAHGLVDAALWGNKAALLPWLLLALIGLLFGASQDAE